MKERKAGASSGTSAVRSGTASDVSVSTCVLFRPPGSPERVGGTSIVELGTLELLVSSASRRTPHRIAWHAAFASSQPASSSQ